LNRRYGRQSFKHVGSSIGGDCKLLLECCGGHANPGAKELHQEHVSAGGEGDRRCGDQQPAWMVLL
jgi:hypothetical protein